MKQKFSKDEYKKFRKYLDIKDEPSQLENNFINKAYKYINYIKWLPWLKMVWIWNSVSMNSANIESDIDLYIVSRENTMWINRILISLIFQILWVRKTEKKHTWMFCLSFFSTSKWMDFSNWKIENDIYLYFWILYFKPLLSYNKSYDLFIEKNSNWIDINDYTDLIKENKKYIIYSKNTKETIFLKYIYTKLDLVVKKIFLPKTLRHFKKLWKPYWIIVNDDLLKFHDNDIRKKTKKEILD